MPQKKKVRTQTGTRLPVFPEENIMPREGINITQHPGVCGIIYMTDFELFTIISHSYQFLQMLTLDYLCKGLGVQLRSQNTLVQQKSKKHEKA